MNIFRNLVKNYAILIVICIFTIFLLVSSNSYLYPEVFYFPRLLNWGQIPYLNYFDHHGPLAYILLAPFSYDKSLVGIKLFYIFVYLLSIVAVYLILKKKLNRMWLILFIFLFTLIFYGFSGYHMWFEQIINLFLLWAYVFLMDKKKEKYFISGLLLAFASLIKPTISITFIFLLIYYRNRKLLFGFMIPWFLTGIFFFINNGWSYFIDCLFLFNSYYGKLSIKNLYMFADWKIFMVLFGLDILVLANETVRKIYNRDWVLITIILTSILIIFPRYALVTLTSFTCFSLIYIFIGFAEFKSIWIKIFILLCIFGLGVSAFREYILNKNIKSYIATNYNLVNFIRENTDIDSNFYILSNQIDVYYSLDKKLPVYFPLIFPWFSDYYGEKIPDRIISDLESQKIEYIVLPKVNDINYTNIRKILEYIKNKYSYKTENLEYTILKRI